MAEWADYPVTLRIHHIAEIYSLHVQTVYEKLKANHASIPRPHWEHPMRWRKDDVRRHHATSSIAAVRREEMQQRAG